jgi:hypothetical protein
MTAADFEASTAELRALALEIRDRSDLMIRVGLGTPEYEAAYAEAQEVLEDIEMALARRGGRPVPGASSRRDGRLRTGFGPNGATRSAF